MSSFPPPGSGATPGQPPAGPPPAGPPPPGFGPPGPQRPPPGPSTAAGPPWVLIGALALALVVIAVLGAVLLARTPTVGSLEVGDCLGSPELAAGDASLSGFDVVDCGSPHDAEVLAVLELGEGEDRAEVCAAEVTGLDDLVAAGVEVRPMTEPEELDEGDALACVARRTDGEPVTGRFG